MHEGGRAALRDDLARVDCAPDPGPGEDREFRWTVGGVFAALFFGREEFRRQGPAPATIWEPSSKRNRDPKHYEKIC